MSTLNLATVELVSTLREAPMNGSPSSQDYNDSWTESLADLASLSGFINDLLIPMLNGLIGTIQPNPNAAPLGLEGRFIYGDTTDTTNLFYDSLASSSLSIADSLRVVNGIITTVQTAMTGLTVQVQSLQTQLSSTNQNDVARALQNFSASLQNNVAQTVANTQAISSNTQQLGKQQHARVTTGPITNGSPATIYVPFPTPYSDDNYTFSLTLQDASGDLSVNQIQQYDGPEVFDLDGGTAIVVSGTPNVGTVTVPQIYSFQINPSDSITFASTGTSLDTTTNTVATAILSVGVWTVVFNTVAAPFTITSLSAGTLTDNTEGPAGVGVSALVTNSDGSNPHTGILHLLATHD